MSDETNEWFEEDFDPGKNPFGDEEDPSNEEEDAAPEATSFGDEENPSKEEEDAAPEATPFGDEADSSTEEDAAPEATPFGDEEGPSGEEEEVDSEVAPFGDEETAGPDSDSGGGWDQFGGGGGDSVPGGDPFDDGAFGGGDFDAAFDAGMGDTGFEEEFDSDIPRIDLGIDGLDEMIQGGVPERSLLVTVGAAGTGKTTVGLQFLREGLRNGEKGVFITLEEDRGAVLEAAEEKDWAFEQHVEEGSLAVVDLDPIEMANSLASIRTDLPRLVHEFGAQRLVLDSVSLLEMMYDNQARRRTEVFDFTKSLKEAGVTTMLTSEASEGNPYASRHGIIEYLTDGVFVLQYVRKEFRETRLAVEIQKIRNANHSRETKPYEITNDGISVYQEASIF